jgi:hypothetical protein
MREHHGREHGDERVIQQNTIAVNQADEYFMLNIQLINKSVSW